MTGSVYSVVELIGSSPVSWEEAARDRALKSAGVKDITVDLTMPDLIDALKPKGDLAALKAALDAKDAGAVPAALP